MTAEQIIKLFDMKPLPDEGGHYVETYRAMEKTNSLPDRYAGARNFSTAILYLITPGNFSKLHRVKSDEVFHFYLGDAVKMLQISETGKAESIILGSDIMTGQRPQVLVEKGVWQGTKLFPDGKFALLGCTVAPGFEFADYETGNRENLTTQFPAIKKIIEKYL